LFIRPAKRNNLFVFCKSKARVTVSPKKTQIICVTLATLDCGNRGQLCSGVGGKEKNKCLKIKNAVGGLEASLDVTRKNPVHNCVNT
jgi:hypothetical protein